MSIIRLLGVDVILRCFLADHVGRTCEKTKKIGCRKNGNGYSSGVFKHTFHCLQILSILTSMFFRWVAQTPTTLAFFWAGSGSGHFLVQSFFARNKTLGHCHEDVGIHNTTKTTVSTEQWAVSCRHLLYVYKFYCSATKNGLFNFISHGISESGSGP